MALVVVGAPFVPLCFVEHRSVLRWISIGERVGAVVGNLVGVRTDSCRHFRLRLRKDIVGKRDVLLQCTRTGRVLNTDDLVVVHAMVHALRNGRHIIVDGSRLSDIPLGVGYRRGRDCSSSRFSDIMLVVGWRRRNRTPGLSVQSIIVIRDIAFGARLNGASLISRRTCMTERAINQ